MVRIKFTAFAPVRRMQIRMLMSRLQIAALTLIGFRVIDMLVVFLIYGATSRTFFHVYTHFASMVALHNTPFSQTVASTGLKTIFMLMITPISADTAEVFAILMLMIGIKLATLASVIRQVLMFVSRI